jgi:hypothetical protein
MCVGKEPRSVGEKLCAWAASVQLGIRRAEKVKAGHRTKGRPEFNGCPHKTTLKMEAICSSETSVYFQ